MGACYHPVPPMIPERVTQYRHVVWLCLVLNAAMFAAEIALSILSGSLALLADAIDFLSDALIFAATLWALGAGGCARSRTAIFNGLIMMSLGSYVLIAAIGRLQTPVLPLSHYMIAAAVLALAVNSFCAWRLAAFRSDDANSRSVWLCSRNDAIGNLAVLLSGIAVAALQIPWPDLLVAAGLSLLAIASGLSIIRQARRELAAPPDQHHH